MSTIYEMSIKEKLKDIERSLAKDQRIDYLANKELILNILELRERKNVLILGHNYMAPLVYQLSNENQRGDSLALSRYAAKADNPIILFDGVRFMAETAKILNPGKKVLISDLAAGCSLADNFSAKDVLEYKSKYPGIPVVTYINSYAEVKAESDYCCTSANGLEVILHAAREYKKDKVIFIPDSLMGENLQDDLNKDGHKIDLIYPGKYDKKFARCEVHEKIKPEDIKNIRLQYSMPKGSKDTAIIVHPECLKETVAEADFSGSTSAMVKYIRSNPELKKVYLGTECEMTSNMAAEFPEVEFIKTCNVFCQHMRKINLEKILYSLQNEVYEINVDDKIITKARLSIYRMLDIKK